DVVDSRHGDCLPSSTKGNRDRPCSSLHPAGSGRQLFLSGVGQATLASTLPCGFQAAPTAPRTVPPNRSRATCCFVASVEYIIPMHQQTFRIRMVARRLVRRRSRSSQIAEKTEK